MLEDQSPNDAPPRPHESQGVALLQSALSAMAEVAANEANLLPPPTTSSPTAASQPATSFQAAASLPRGPRINGRHCLGGKPHPQPYSSVVAFIWWLCIHPSLLPFPFYLKRNARDSCPSQGLNLLPKSENSLSIGISLCPECSVPSDPC